jgi:hypothetical protein
LVLILLAAYRKELVYSLEYGQTRDYTKRSFPDYQLAYQFARVIPCLDRGPNAFSRAVENGLYDIRGVSAWRSLFQQLSSTKRR